MSESGFWKEEKGIGARHGLRVTMWAMILLGPLIAPILCLGGLLLHAVVS